MKSTKTMCNPFGDFPGKHLSRFFMTLVFLAALHTNGSLALGAEK